MSLNHILLGGTWERLTLRSRALVAIRRNCYVQQNFNSWWKTSDERTQTFLFPFLFIYLFIFLSFGFSFRSIDVLDCIESRRNIFGFWILLIIPVPLNPSLVLAVELRSKTRGMGKWPNYTRFHTKTGQKPYPVRPIKGCTSRNPDPLGGPPLGPTPQVLSVSSC